MKIFKKKPILLACIFLCVLSVIWLGNFVTNKTFQGKDLIRIEAISKKLNNLDSKEAVEKGTVSICRDSIISRTPCAQTKELITDQNNSYRLVEIDGQCWFLDNMKDIPSIGWSGFYEGRESDGRLYTWDAAMNGKKQERSQGICPEGWHIPSYCESLLKENKIFPLKQSGIYNASFDTFDFIGDTSIYWTSSVETYDNTEMINSVSIDSSGKVEISSNPYINTKSLNNGFHVKCIRD